MKIAFKRAAIALAAIVLLIMLYGCQGGMRDQVIIEYLRQGGIAGFHDELVIRENRETSLETTAAVRSFELDAGRYEDLIQLFETQGFLQMESDYMPEDLCCDLFAYTVTYRGHTVATMTTAEPDALLPILAALDSIVRDYEGR